MPTYLLSHRHEAGECGPAFAAWRGFSSPLRHRTTMSSCAWGGHALWWVVEAAGPRQALSHLPAFVAERTEVTEVEEVPIP